jgi:hypothetical protein
MRCRTGTVKNTALWTVPGLHWNMTQKCVMREDGRSSRTLVLEMMTIPVGGDYQDSQESCRYCGSAIASDTSATCLRQLVAKQ